MKNNNTQIDKKIFIAGKVYDLLTMNKDTVEASVRTYLDSVIGKNRVRFELCTIGNAVTMFFHRGLDCGPYNADPAKDIMDADVFTIIAHEYEGFITPVLSPTLSVLGFDYPYHISQTDPLGTYCRSTRILGASRTRNASLDINPVSAILRVQIG